MVFGFTQLAQVEGNVIGGGQSAGLQERRGADGVREHRGQACATRMAVAVFAGILGDLRPCSRA